MRRLFFFLCLVAPSPAFAQVIWDNVRAGMTVAQIRAAQPAARAPRVRETLNDGAAVCQLEIQGTEVAGQRFDTCFFMDGGRLVQVMSTARNPSRPLVDVLAAHLRERYGAEVGAGEDPCSATGPLNLCDLNWRPAGGVEINITYADVDGEGAALNINYRALSP